MFLLRRNLPLAWAGWYDDFTAYGVTSLRQPWKHLGDGVVADYNALGELHIPANYFTNNGGGESYEFQPFTPNWGLEFEVWWPVEGLAAQSFTCFITDSWARVGALFQNLVGIQLRHTDVGGDTIGINGYANIIGFNDHEGQWAQTAFKGKYTTVRIWVENDEFIRLWVDGVLTGTFQLTNPTYKLGPDRRCVRFLNAALCDCWMRWIDHYDRTPSIPPKTVWSQVHYDNFDGRSGNQDGVNGWTQLGTNAGVVDDAWSTINTVNGGRALLWDTGNTSGKVRIEATVKSVATGVYQGLVLGTNAAGTTGLIARVRNGDLILGYFTTALSNDQPTWGSFRNVASGLSAGSKVALTMHNGMVWIEVDGVPKLYAVSDTYVSQTRAGLWVSRISGANSGAWDDVRIYSGV
ncbi:hypothetical protein ACWCPQ_14680 [Nocardia sp. NPDC001965]